jgi:methyl-accepting chemotaxis protein
MIMATKQQNTQQQEEVKLGLDEYQGFADNAPINIMYCDKKFNIVYANRKSLETLESIEEHLPIKVKDLVGINIDVFHKKPEHQRRLLKDDKNLPHRAIIAVGPEKLDLLVSPVYDKSKEYIGAMVTWEVITEKVALTDSLAQAARQLSSAAQELNATATQLTSNSEETTAQANAAHTSAEEVSRGVETVATNTEEMNASIKEIARNANEASSHSKDTQKQAESTNETITKLGKSSQEIGNVIKVISSIAQQTNLLALNATIEAARAGEAGRGFAVVANEVKELAKQTANATEEITNKINAIQHDSSGAVSAIKTITYSIEKLNSIAGSIAASVEEQMATTSEVARVVQASSLGVKGISENVKQVFNAAKSTNIGANQLVDAARGLAQLAEQMQELVKRIQV